MFRPPRGMRDFMPAEMVKRQFVLDTIRAVFERWGYEAMDTPAVESFELLAAKSGAGEAIKREIYYFKDQGGREMGLRFDLTVSTARILATNPGLSKPFKRYIMGKAWRYDKPGYGRFREFVQADVDIFGSALPEADAEIVAVACDAFSALGFKDFIIRVNNRKLIEGYVRSVGVKEKDIIEVLRSIDKLDKIGERGVRNELKEKGIASNAITKIMQFIKIKGDITVLEKIKTFIADGSMAELKEFLEKVRELGYEKAVVIDLSLARGLDYYTGLVFEVAVAGGKWALAGGGRFDRMIEQLGGQSTPATGISLGFERIIEVMKEEGMFKLPPTATKVFVAATSEAVRADCIRICQELRAKGVAADIDLLRRKLARQLEYAAARRIPFVVIVGPKELKDKKVVLRDMVTGREEKIEIKNLPEKLKIS